MTLPVDSGVRERALAELGEAIHEQDQDLKIFRLAEFISQQLIPFVNYELLPFMRAVRELLNRRFGSVVHVDSDYTVEFGVQYVLVDTTDGVVSVTLPAVDEQDCRITVKRVAGSNNVTITPPSGATVDGGASAMLTVANQAVDVLPDNTDPDTPRYWLVGTYP